MEKEVKDRQEKEASLRLEMRTMIFRHGWPAFLGAVQTILKEAPAHVQEEYRVGGPLSDGEPQTK